MQNHRQSLPYRAGRYVTNLLVCQLPTDRVFHNVHHTINVVQGVVDIGFHEGVTAQEQEILLLAAWFHDTGHVRTYAGHEEVSCELAGVWLRRNNYPEDRVQEVLRVIHATTMPQNPGDRLERIICDADLYHLSFQTYDHYQEVLREEWKKVLQIKMSDEEWAQQNDAFLRKHRYWTDFGRRVLEPKKSLPGNDPESSG